MFGEQGGVIKDMCLACKKIFFVWHLSNWVMTSYVQDTEDSGTTILRLILLNFLEAYLGSKDAFNYSIWNTFNVCWT